MFEPINQVYFADMYTYATPMFVKEITFIFVSNFKRQITWSSGCFKEEIPINYMKKKKFAVFDLNVKV